MDKRDLIAHHKKMMQKDSTRLIDSDIDVGKRVQSLERKNQNGETNMALDTFRVSAYSSQVLVVLITKKFILNFEPVSWFRLEDCYISFPVSLNAKREKNK